MKLKESVDNIKKKVSFPFLGILGDSVSSTLQHGSNAAAAGSPNNQPPGKQSVVCSTTIETDTLYVS